MKNVFLLIIMLTLVTGVWAATTATPSSTAKATPAPTTQIDDLKERLATKVAELRQSERKAIAGPVKAVTVSTFTVETQGKDVKIELTDEIKVFETLKGKRTTLTTDDIAKDDLVVVFGDYDTGLDLLKAKVVVIQKAPMLRVAGVVTSVDRTEFTATIKTFDGQEYVVDIEKATTALSFDKDKGLVKGGFSKLVAGNAVHFVGTPNAKIDHRVSAIRLIDLGNLTGETPEPTAEVTPTASASATPKSTPKATPKPTTKPTATPTP